MKLFVVASMLCSLLQAEMFESFLQKAIENSPYLKASQLQIQQSQEAGAILTRYKNPELEVEASYFDLDSADGEMGFRASYAQPIRLWGVDDQKDALSQANTESAKSTYLQARAAFVRDLSLQYTTYAQSDLLKKLADEERLLAKTIYEISKARYEAGTISRGIMLQAQVDYKMLLGRVQALSLIRQRNYYALLKYAGIEEELALETEHTFIAQTHAMQNPERIVLQNRAKQAQASAKLNSNKVEWMRLMGEYEKEPDQDIFRFGASIPLAFFNTKTEEKRIATLEASRSEMLVKNLDHQLRVEKRRLEFESQNLQILQKMDEDILADEQELLKMYEEGYKIANINLLALQDVKSRLIETKERLIKIKIERDRNAIIHNYLQGNYND